MTAHSSARAFRPGDYRPSSVTDGLDAAAVADMLEQRKMAVLAYLLPNGKKNGHEYCVGSLAGEAGESLKVNLNGKGCVWKDFAAPVQKGGGDLLDLWAAVRGTTIAGAYAEALDWLGHERTTKPRPTTRAKSYRPADVIYDYTDAAGNVGSRVHRWEATGAEPKRFAGQTLMDDGSWSWQHPPTPRPLYGLAELAARPDAPVLLNEGEKAAEGARDHLPDHVSMSCSGGTAGIKHTDFGPLKGRNCVLWPDNDPEGRVAMEQAAELLTAVGAAEVRIVTIPEGLPAKWDLGDPLPAGWASETVNKLISDAAVYSRPEPSAPRPSPPPANWPAPIGDDAKTGLAWDFVATIAPYSEADPMALLLQFLVTFGAAAGRSPHFTVESTRHGTNLFAVLVGRTSTGRKGTAGDHVKRLIEDADPTFAHRMLSGLASGEGLIHHVRDGIFKGDDAVDEGVSDKRLLSVEPEFSRVLKVASREGCTLSDTMRCLWESGDARTLTRSSPLKATGAHVAIMGHITEAELTRLMTDTDMANGMANRHLFACVRRSKILPDGGRPDSAALAELTGKVAHALAFARDARELRRDGDARALWHQVYERLTQDRPGLLGAITARAAPQVMRLACIFALLDRTTTIKVEHLKAALAVWKYCDESVACIFGERTGNPIADAIIEALEGSDDGMSRTDLYHHFGRHKSSAAIAAALRELSDFGKVTSEERRTAGRTATVWRAVK
jgi:hypothetical protein